MSLPRRATIVASLTAFMLAVVKLFIGILSGSAAVLASAIDSLLDMLISLFNLYAVQNSEKKIDDRYNYGRGKIEGFAGLLEGALIGASGLFIIYQGAKNIFTKAEIAQLDAALWVMVFSTTVTAALVLFLIHVAKKSRSMVVRADVVHYQSDLYTNLGVIFSLGAIFFTGWHWIDGVVAIAIACVIIYSAFHISKEGFLMLMDRALEPELVEKIEQAIEKAPRVRSYHDLRTRRSANTNLVDLHMVFDEEILLKDAHDISDGVEAAIRALDPDAGWLITVHLDPRDDSCSTEEQIFGHQGE